MNCYLSKTMIYCFTKLHSRKFWMKYSEIDFEKWKVWKFAKKIHLKPKCSIIYVIPAEVSMYRSTLKDEPWPEPVEVRRERIDRYMKEVENGRGKFVIDATSSIEDVFNKTLECMAL